MRKSVRIWSALIVALVLLVVPAALAQEDQSSQQLQKAADLFAQQEYSAAQDALRTVDRDKLDQELQAEFDRLRELLPQAIAASAAAEETLANADTAFVEGRWDEADALYQAVLQNEFAKAVLKTRAAAQRDAVAQKKRLAQAAEPSGVVQAEPTTTAPAPQAGPPAEAQRPPPILEMKQRDELLWQRAEAQARELAGKTREAIEQKKFTEARQLAESALQKIEAVKSYAEPVSKYLAAREAAERLKAEVQVAFEEDQRKTADKERVDIARRIEQRRALIEQQKREKVEQLFLTAEQLRKQQQFAESAEVLRQILHIDPANAKAQHQLEMAEDYASLLSQKGFENDRQRNIRNAVINAQESLIPWDYEVLYPKNWLELTARRSAAGTSTGGTEEDSELNRKLDEILPDFSFQDAPLEQVVEHLQEIQNLNISVDWEDLSGNGIERDKAVTVQLRGLPFRTVLKEVLAQVGGDVVLGFSTGGGLLRIATKERLDRDKHVLVYDIRDLIINIPRFTNATSMDPAQSMNQSLGTIGGGTGGGTLFQTSRGTSETDQRDTDSADMVERIKEIIRQTVETDSWQETGGGDGSIRDLNGQLIVYNTSDAHSRIQGLLDQLRAQRALQVALEARFLNVTSNFLEEFGVDLDFVFNQGSAGFDRAFGANGPIVDPSTGAPVLIPRPYSRIGAMPAPPPFGTPMTPQDFLQPYGQPGAVPSGTGVSPHFGEMTPISAQQGSATLTDPSRAMTGIPGSWAGQVVNPALNLAGSFLDNLQVDFLIRATQANGRSSIVQAPRLVLFNSQRANISIGRTRQYVAGLEPVVGEGAAAVAPIPGFANSGTTLDVEVAISADRRYVTVIVIATQADEPTFERFEVTRASGNSPGTYQMLPSTSFVIVNTTVSIPDGGTVLLGGMKQVGEVELEAGVPILSKIPVLKRAFTNKSMVKDTRTLLILLKSKIIIQKEAEEEAFPSFTSAGAG